MEQRYQVIITPFARQGMKEILEYLAEEVSDEVAEKVRRGLMEAMQGLTEMPTRHSIVGSISDEQTIYRRILKWSYRIIYTIKEQALTVIVVDIAHSRRNPRRIEDLLGGDKS